MTPALTRRGALSAAAVTAAGALAGCGDGKERIPPVKLPPVAPQAEGSELLTLRRLLLLERLQQQRWEAAARLLPADDGPKGARGRALLAEAAVEAEHVKAVAALVHALGGGPPDPFEPGPAPTSLPAAIAGLDALERTVAGAWRSVAVTFVGLETRAAAIAVLGGELRQLAVLATLRGRRARPVPPRALTVPAALTRIGAQALGPVPRA